MTPVAFLLALMATIARATTQHQDAGVIRTARAPLLKKVETQLRVIREMQTSISNAFDLLAHGPLGASLGAPNQVAERLLDVQTRLGANKQSMHIAKLNVASSRPLYLTSCLDCGCDICNSGGVNKRGMFAPVETAIFRAIVGENCNNGATVVDVGANVGYFTMLAGDAGCRTIAFEPQPIPNAMARASVALNGMGLNVTVHRCAISAVAGKGSFVTGRSWGFNRVAPSATNEGDTDMRPLSDFVESDVLLLKVDTEGFEDQVVAGSKEVFTTHVVHNVVMEVKQRDKQQRRDMLRQMMLDAGLKHAYNYVEDYGFTSFMQQGANLGAVLTDVTDTILNSRYDVPLAAEDIWFTREKLAFVA
ncbi:hypothetical protein TSOC_009052 [Tetrabaena socialis]|uniref:Methyltransferase FkbM domain-containing protein n=1 Tax=Tetrabaena socialis TaxID=47790 RepID=A0A2J7ZWT4_9CHLO|nr:hypothetical protein TSOC_009052 [Tetrabaena socialis]|eukprot:PNH04737.1 hypothetical protein TSOC_009052 [Tetrabaena socialis]